MPMLSWAGKAKVVNHHNDVSFRVLERKWGWGKCCQCENVASANANSQSADAEASAFAKAIADKMADKLGAGNIGIGNI